MALLLLPVLWQAVGIAVADLFWSRAPRVALFFDPSNAKARHNYALSLLRLETPDVVAAESELKEALRRDPLAPTILSSLAKIYTAQRQAEKAANIWPLSAATSWRDGDAQLNALLLAIQSQNYAKALRHIDALMRVYPANNSKIVAQITPFIESTRFRDAFLQALSSDPPWRHAFLSSLGQTPISLSALNAVYSGLKSAKSPLTSDELRPYLRRLVAGKYYENAYLLWLTSLPESKKPQDSLLYNYDFRFPISNMPFDWTFDPVPGVDVSIEKRAFNRDLKIVFSHTRSKFSHVKQMLFLSPGNYVFSGRESSDLLNNDRGVRWRIRCVNAPNDALAVTQSLMDTIPWREFSVGFSVTRACPVQEILLEIPARSEGEQVASGTATYSGLFLKQLAN